MRLQEGPPSDFEQRSPNMMVRHCRRTDGTTGLIVGGIVGGALDSAIAPGGANTFGAILGAGAGALAGTAIDRNNVRCR